MSVFAGDHVAIDLAAVHHGNQFLRFNVSMLAYGYYGDCIVDSERNRWMGPKRYDWSGKVALIVFLFNFVLLESASKEK